MESQSGSGNRGAFGRGNPELLPRRGKGFEARRPEDIRRVADGDGQGKKVQLTGHGGNDEIPKAPPALSPQRGCRIPARGNAPGSNEKKKNALGPREAPNHAPDGLMNFD